MKVRVKRLKTERKWAVGIDPSLTGFAMAFYCSGATDFLTARYTSKHKGIDRLIDIGGWMDQTLGEVTAYDVGMVCLEGYAPNSKWGREVAGELCGMVKMELRTLFPDPVCYPTVVAPSMLKKFVTGTGNAKKDQMMMATYKKWGFEAKTNDEADAYGLARVAAAILGIDQPGLAYERDVLSRLEPWTEKPR
jgi:hypothetical protein